MNIDILASFNSRHQCEHAAWLAAGLARHGITSSLQRAASACTSDTVACWGWRSGAVFAAQGKRVLVMERAYMGDRFMWTSLGWNGLNGRAVMPVVDDAARFNRFHKHLMRDWSTNGAYILLVGQVPGDAALQGRSLSQWYLDTADALAARHETPVLFRRHPKAYPGAYPSSLTVLDGTLADALAGATLVVTYNSNTAVEAVLAGKPTLAMDSGSMAWEVTGHGVGDLYTGDRQAWANRLAYKQWLPHEIEDGTALEYLLPLVA